jgi:alkyl sulfatase BDS1-like metallo-beta-lactamase superfamily hydrolase
MRSFDTDPSVTVDGPRGQRVHRRSLDQTARLEHRLYSVRPGVWCLVGNGLSNQTFIEGPQGIVAIGTGESIEEMRAALNALRRHTQAPIKAHHLLMSPVSLHRLPTGALQSFVWKH